MNVRLSQNAVNHAKKLIKAGDYLVDTDWSDAQPSTKNENDYLDEHGWEEW